MIRRSTAEGIVLSAASGGLHVLSLPRADVYPLAWIALTPLLLAITYSSRCRSAATRSYFCGVVFFAGAFSWFTDTMTVYGGLPAALSAGVWILFASVYALYFAVFGAALWAIQKRFPAWGLLAAPAVWVSVEFMRARWFSGFPWMLAGYSVAPYTGLLQMASWTGVHGLSFVVLGVNAALALAFVKRRRTLAIPAVAIVAAAAFTDAPQPSEAALAALAVTVVQPNIAIDHPWNTPSGASLLGDIVRLSQPAPSPPDQPRLIVWPENPAPFYLREDAEFRSRIERLARNAAAYVLLGYIDRIGDGASNSAGVVDPSGRVVSRYDKMHLVPFGEYVPWFVSGIVGKMTRNIGDFRPGTDYTVTPVGSGSIATLICYESIFPELSREMVRRGAGLLAVITNDGWFGETAAPFQHLRMAQVRAAETRRYIVRSANTGISAIIDPYGRVIQSTGLGERTALNGSVYFRTGLTAFVRFGDWFPWMCGVVSVGLLLISVRRNERNK